MALNQITYVLILQYTIAIDINETIEIIKSTLQPMLNFNPTTPTSTALLLPSSTFPIYYVQGWSSIIKTIYVWIIN